MPPSPKRQAVLSKACESCKARKSRCDSARPKCGGCQKKGNVCVYREKGQPGLRPGYGKNVEQRLSQLEHLWGDISANLRDINEKLSSAPASTENQTMHSPTLRSITSPAAEIGVFPTPQSGVKVPYTQGQELGGSPSTHDALAICDDFLKPNEGYFNPSFEPMATAPDFSIFTFRDPSAESPLGDGLPSAAMLRELASLFFKHVHPSNEIFHEPSFMENLFVPGRRLLLHAVTLVSLRFWDKPTPDAQTRERYLQSSRSEIIVGAVESVSLVSTQALALLAMESFASSPGLRVTGIMSLLITAARQLRLGEGLQGPTSPGSVLVTNETLEESPVASDVETEERRRLLLLIYTVDRFVALSHGSTCQLNMDDLQHAYPANDDKWEDHSGFANNPPSANTTKGASLWRYWIEILQHLDQTHQFLLRPLDFNKASSCQGWQSKFRELDLDICSWFQRLPAAIKERPQTFDPMWVCIHATFYVVIIRMHSIAAFPPIVSTYFKKSSTAAKRCLHAVEGLSAVFGSLTDADVHKLSPLCAFLIWIASRNLIILWTTDPNYASIDMPPVLEKLLHVLNRMADLWKCAQHFADLAHLMIDTRNSHSEDGAWQIFKDTGRTTLGLCSRLGDLAQENRTLRLGRMWDLLDVSFLDQQGGPSDFADPGIFETREALDWIS